MKIVIDANILFSAFLAEGSHYRDILFDDAHILYAPNFLFLEIFRHKEKILKYTKEPESEVYEFLGKILQRIRFVSEEFVSVSAYAHAYVLCKEIDEDDIPFVALTLELDGYLLTGDLRLKRGLTKRGFKKFMPVSEPGQ